MATTADMQSAQHKPVFPPGPKARPIFGNLLEFARNQPLYLQKMQRIYGEMATMHIGKAPVVLLFRPEYVRYLLTENPRNFTSIQSRDGNLRETLGEGLLTIEGDAHRQQRRMVQPAFHRKRVEGYAEDMVRYTQEMLTTWHAGEELDMARAMQALTLRIVGKSLFNIEQPEVINELGTHFTQMIESRMSILERLFGLKLNLPFTGYGKRMAAKRHIDSFIYQLIAERRATGNDSGDVLSMLLAAQESEEDKASSAHLSDSQVRNHVMTFVAAGHETTANALTWTFYLLAQQPEVCAKLIAELQSVLAGRAPTIHDIANLPYTEWILNESMRLYPPAWTIGRRAIHDFELNGYTFPAGTTFMMSQWVIQRMPELWGDAENFRPERWNPEGGEQPPQWSYFPFGGGPRICIGMPFAQMEAKLLLATILQSYTPRMVPGFQVELLPLVTLRPKHGMRMIIETTQKLV